MRIVAVVAVTCATLAFVSAAVAADEGAVTTDELKTMCKTLSIVHHMGPVPRTSEEVVALKADSACTFYVAGLANLIMLPGVAKSLKFCLPEKMTMDQLRLTIEGLMRDAPKEMLEYNAALSIIAGLRMNFPCGIQ